MTIYSPIKITEQMIMAFKPTRLYIKELAGIKYFGKTTCSDPYLYSGSGVVWRDRIKKYGRDNIKTLWVSDEYTDPFLLQEVALHFSMENNIVESEMWANLRPETGLDGATVGQYSGEKSYWFGKKGSQHSAYGRIDSEDTKKRKGESKLGDNNPMKRPEMREKMREQHRRTQQSVGENNPMYGKKGKDNPNFGQKRPVQSEKMKNKTWKIVNGKRVVTDKIVNA